MNNDKHIRILYLENEEVDRDAFRRTLDALTVHSNVVTASNYTSGLEAAVSNSFDCIFLDYYLQGDVGSDFITEVRSHGIATPIIVITSLFERGLYPGLIEAGATDYVAKSSLTPDVIRQLIYSVLYRQQLQTEKKDVQRLLQLNDEKLLEIERIAKLGTWELDVQSKQIAGSQEFYFLLGMEAPVSGYLTFAQFNDFILPQDRATFIKAFNNTLNTSEDFKVDISLQTKAGSLKHVDVQGRANLNTIGQVEKVLGFIQDITNRKEIEEQLRKADEQTKQLTKVKDQFLANMSHEIRTPLNGIIGFTDMLLQTPLTEDQLQLINVIRYSSDTLMAIINDVLDITKIEAGDIHFEKKEFNLYQLVQSLKKFFEVKVQGREVQFSVKHDESIPKLLIGDPQRLNQILLNLTSNAVKFTEKGEVKIQTRIINTDAGNVVVEFSLSDTGIGIPGEYLYSIFDRFTQVDSDNNRRYGGTGIGLAIVKELIERQGGNIKVDSEVGKGTTFTFVLKFAIPGNEDSRANYLIQEPVQSELLHGIRVLLAEDNLMNQMLAKRVLTSRMIQVDVAGTGKIAVDEVLKNNYDLVLMDLQMPEMDGYEATSIIRSRDFPKRDVPIIALTAHAHAEEVSRCLKAGMNNFLSKPFNAEDLINKIYSVVQKRRSSSPMPDTEEKTNNEGVVNPLKRMTNLAYLESIGLDNKDFIREMVALFIDKTPKDLSNIEMALAKQDLQSVYEIVHKIKPTFDMVGIQDAKPLLTEIERDAKAGQQYDAIVERLARLKQLTSLALAELKLIIP